MSQLTVFSLPTYRPNSLLWQAAVAALAGVLLYLVGRDQVPGMTPLWLQTQPSLVHLRSFWPDFLTLQLPSFLHAYVILSLGVLVCGASRLASVAIVGGTLLCLALEWIQHPAVTAVIAGSMTSMPDTGTTDIGMTSSILNAALEYAIAGTFDYFDLGAILLATALLMLQIFTPFPSLVRFLRRL